MSKKNEKQSAGFRELAGRAQASLIALGFVALSVTGFEHLVADEHKSRASISVLSQQATVDESVELVFAEPAEDSWELAPHPVLDKNDHLTLGMGLKPTPKVEAKPQGQGLKLGDDALKLSVEMLRVRDWVSSTYRVSGASLEPVLLAAENNAQDAGLDPLLLVAMMAVESSFNHKAVSHAGAQGLMQVIPRWHMDKIGDDAPKDALFDPVFNVQVGTQVLVEGIQRYGSLQEALQYYGGARNDPQARYSRRVMAMKRQLVQVARADGDV